MEKEQLVAKNIGDNILYYRTLNNLTQYELAKQLNYSDKSISKWERSEGIPSVVVLNELAVFFDVSLNDLVNKKQVKPKYTKQQQPLLYSLIVWLVALLTFSLLVIFKVNYPAWHLFLVATSATGLIFFIFNLVWKKRLFYYLSFAVFIYVFAVILHLSFAVKPYIFYISATAIYVFFSYLLYYLSKK